MLLLPEKRKFLEIFSKTIYDRLFELCCPIGHIRWYFIRENKKIDFSKINFETFIDKSHLTLNFDECINEIRARNGGSSIDAKQIFAKIQEQSKNSIDPWLLCQGHDLIRVLFLILPRVLGDYAPSQADDARSYFEYVHSQIPNEKRLTEQLILGFDGDFFRKTNIYSDLKSWEKRNTNYLLLRNE